MNSTGGTPAQLFAGPYGFIMDPTTSHLYGVNGQSFGYGSDGHVEIYVGPGGFGQSPYGVTSFKITAGPDFSTRIGPDPLDADPVAVTLWIDNLSGSNFTARF